MVATCGRFPGRGRFPRVIRYSLYLEYLVKKLHIFPNLLEEVRCVF